MGKKRSNRNKRKKNIRNVLENPCNEKKVDAVLQQNEKKEKYNSNDGNSSVAQKKLIDPQFPMYNLIPSCKENSDSKKSVLNVSLPTNNKDLALKISESDKTVIKTMYLSNEHALQNSDVKKYIASTKSAEICRSAVSKPITYRSENSCVSSKKGISSEFYFENEMPEAVPNLSKNESSDRHLMKSSSASDEEYSTSDFFQPVFQSGYKAMISKNIHFLEEKNWEENFCGKADEACDYKEKNWEENFYGKADEAYDYKKKNSPEAGYSGVRNSYKNQNFEGKKLKENISNSVSIYKNSKDYFSNVYHTWLPKRKNALEKLRTLYTEVHDDQLNYNKTQAAFRELGFNSRAAKLQDNQTVNFFASFTAFLSDAATGITSFAQAFNIDSYQIKFQEIMDEDAESTKLLYKARSQCVGKYRDIEEVMRKFHSNTFSSTVNKISNTLQVDKYWTSMKDAYGKDDMPKLLDVVGKFIDNACQSENLEEVSDSIQSYVNINPAAVEVCKSTGRATCGALDTFAGNNNRNSVLGKMDTGVNMFLMIEDKKEVDRLRNVIDEDSPQSKLESQIEDAIDSLESEMKEINDIYFQLFGNYDNDYSDDDIFA